MKYAFIHICSKVVLFNTPSPVSEPQTACFCYLALETISTVDRDLMITLWLSVPSGMFTCSCFFLETRFCLQPRDKSFIDDCLSSKFYCWHCDSFGKGWTWAAAKT